MKILFTMSPAFDPTAGGVQRTTYKMGRYFYENGHEVHYLSLKHDGHTTEYAGNQHHVNEPGIDENKNNLTFTEQLIGQIQPNIVINQMPYLQGLSGVLEAKKKEYGFKLIGCLRNTLFSFKDNARDTLKRHLPAPVFQIINNPVGIGFFQLRHRLKHAKELRIILDRHDYFVLLTPPNQVELEYFVGKYKKEKVAVIPNSIPDVYESESKKENILLYVGKMGLGHKRADLLLPVWKQIAQELPDWKFIIVGPGGDYKKVMENQIIDEKIPRVEMHGRQPSEPYYEKAKLFMMTSEKEGFPNVLLEAQSYGTVPFAFNSYLAVNDIIEHKKNGFLYPPFDIKAMGEGIVTLAKDENERRKAVQKALRNAGQYTIAKVGKKWLTFFNEITSS